MLYQLCLFLVVLHTSTNVIAEVSHKITEQADKRTYYIQNPLLLNKDNIYILVQLGVLTEKEKQSFCHFVSLHGYLTDIEDLIILPYWYKSTIAKIRPYIRMPKQATVVPKKQPIKKNVKFLVVPGQSKKKDEGSAHKLDTSFIYQQDKCTLGILAYKSVGESLYYAYYRFFILFEDISKYVKRLIIGTYMVNLGHGLVTGSSKRLDNLKAFLSQSRNILKPCKSNSRNQGLRGAGIHLSHNRFTAVIHAAYNNYFATLHEKDKESEKPIKDINNAYIKTIPTRVSDIAYRNTTMYQEKSLLREYLFGAAFIFRLLEGVKVGVQGLLHKYHPPVWPGGTAIDTHKKLGFFADIKRNIHQFKAEVAVSESDLATILAHKINFSKGTNFIILLRHYSANFYSLHGDNNSDQQDVVLMGEKKIGKKILTGSTAIELKKPHNKKQKRTRFINKIIVKREMNKSCSLTNQCKVVYTPITKEICINWKLAISYVIGNLTLGGVFITAFDILKNFSFGLCANVTWVIGKFKAVFHCTLFSAKQHPLYFYVPDIQSTSLAPRIQGTGIRFGIKTAYAIIAKLVTLHGQFYVTYKQGDNLSPVFKVQLAYGS